MKISDSRLSEIIECSAASRPVPDFETIFEPVRWFGIPPGGDEHRDVLEALGDE